MRTIASASFLLACAAVVSCAPEPTDPTMLSCSGVGQRLGETPIKGIIFGSVGTKVMLAACPHRQIPIAFLGKEPAELSRLKEVAAQRADVVGFDALADGYVVQESDGHPVLILVALSSLREDPRVAKEAQAAAPR